jgi:hypothetical protein
MKTKLVSALLCGLALLSSQAGATHGYIVYKTYSDAELDAQEVYVDEFDVNIDGSALPETGNKVHLGDNLNVLATDANVGLLRQYSMLQGTTESLKNEREAMCVEAHDMCSWDVGYHLNILEQKLTRLKKLVLGK